MLRVLIFLFFLLLPVGWAKHWIVPNSLVNGVLVDYLMPDVWVQDLFAIMIIIAKVQSSKFPGHASGLPRAGNFQNIFPKPRLLITNYLLPARNALLTWRAWPITLVVISILLSPIPLISAINFGRFLLAISVGWIVLKNKKLHRPAAAGLSGAVVWTSFLAVGQFVNQGTVIGWQFLGEPFYSLGTGGVKKIFIFGQQLVAPMATFPHANVMGAFGLLAFLVLSRYSAEVDKFFKIARYFSLILISLSFSLPVWILTFIILIIGKNSTTIMVLSLLITAVVFLLTINYQLPATSFHRRWSLVKYSLTIIKSHPFFGVGWGGFVRHLPPSTFLQPVHNVFLLILAELGIIGASGLVLVAREYLKKFELKNYLLLITVYLLLFTVDHYFWTTTQGVYMLFFMLSFYQLWE